MSFIKKLGKPSLFMLILCAVIIGIAEYLFLTGHELQGIFIGLWAPMVLGLVILFKLVTNDSK
jgi:uncharacterized membrane protein YvlD (DUF360 family)